MNRYAIYCTQEQTVKARELGAPIGYKNTLDNRERGRFEIPTAEQMIGWLEKQGDLIIVYHDIDWLFSINHFEGEGRFNSRQEATLAAIDAALDYLVQAKEEKQ